MADNKKKDELLDHEADGIQEFDNALPRWWLYGFYFTIIFSFVYIGYYHFGGGPSSHAEYKQELAEAAVAAKNIPAKAAVALMPLTDAGSLNKGKEIFESTNSLCFTCHRNDLGGMVGPNLTDDKWLHGCSLDDIMASIRHGYPDKGMLPYGSNNKLGNEQLHQLASYIISKRGSNPADAKPADAERDKECK